MSTKQRLSKTLGRHARLGLPFRWTIGGKQVNLQADGYSAQAYVKKPDGEVTGPHAVSIDGQVARFLLPADALDTASASDDANVEVVVVATSNENTLPSDIREIPVGEWGGAELFNA